MTSNRPAGVRPRGLRACAAAMLILAASPAPAQETAPVPATAASPAPVQPAPAAAPPAPAASAAAPAGSQPATAAPAPAPQPAGEAPVSLPEVAAGPSAHANLPHDLSPWGMFMSADIVVKAVMAGLAFASLVTWTIWFAKVLELAHATRRARRGLARLEEAETLAAVEAGRWAKRGPVAALVRTAQDETERSAELPADGVKERTAIALQRIEARAGRRMTRGTGLLATIGSTAPFVGLFGTVWGIMNSFIGISQANTTNLAVVAPGIAEALLATAIGLVAAIPAVIVYNVFSRSIAGYRGVLADASAEVMRHLSRDLDRRLLQRPAARLQAAE